MFVFFLSDCPKTVFGNVKPAIHWGIYNFMKINERTLLVRKSHFEGDIPPILYEFILELWAKFGR